MNTLVKLGFTLLFLALCFGAAVPGVGIMLFALACAVFGVVLVWPLLR